MTTSGSEEEEFGDDGAFGALELIDANTTTTGVLIARYRVAERPMDQNN